MSNIQVILFDLGGTLVYFDADWPAALRQAGAAMAQRLCELGYTVDPVDFGEAFCVRMDGYRQERDEDGVEDTTAVILSQELTRAGHTEVPDGVLRDALRALYRVTQPHWVAEEDTVETLRTLQTAGYRMGILSNAADDADVRVLVQQAGIAPFMDMILTSAMVGMRKPHHRIFDSALKALAAAPDQVVMVGDKLDADVQGAKAAGMRTVWLFRRAPGGLQNPAAAVRPDAMAANLACLPVIIQRFNQASQE